MGKSLFDYANEQNEKSYGVDNRKIEETMQENIDKYKDLSSDELQKELFSEVAKQKQNGNFDYSSLVNSANTLSPYLSEEQKSRLEKLLEQIK